MKRLIVYLLTIICCLPTSAQHFIQGPLHSPDSPREDWLLPGDTIMDGNQKRVYGGKPQRLLTVTGKEPLDQVKGIGLRQPAGEAEARDKNPQANTTDSVAPAPASINSYAWGWHEGLNASIGLSAFATFGDHVPHKGGFTQDINVGYLTPLTKNRKLWLAAGGYLQNTIWGGDSYRDAGLYATLGYRFNEHWEIFAYGQLSLANNYNSYWHRHGWYGYGPYWGMGSPLGRSPLGYGMGAAGANVVGVGAIYHVNPTLSIGVSVEGAWYDNPAPGYNHRYRYDYPGYAEHP